MDCSGERDEVGESTGGEISETECIEDDWLEVGVADEIVQLPHGRKFVVGV